MAGKDEGNLNLPVFVDRESDDVERELILRQLLFLRQEVNEIKQLIEGGKISTNLDSNIPSNSALYLPINTSGISQKKYEKIR